ncbi:MAG: class I SAM-dependent methyltransferase [Solirubrobacteraceae bacterium]
MEEEALKPGGLAALAPGSEPSDAELAACCATAYADPAVRWLLGGQLHPGGADLTRRTLQLAGLRPAERLLDVACGVGDSTFVAIREFGAQAIGIDYGDAAVASARDAADAAGVSASVSFVRGDAAALPFADGAFDLILCECSLSTFADKQRAVAEFRRVLAPGGRLAVSDVIVEGALPTSLTGAFATVACVGGALSSEGYRGLFEKAGLCNSASEPRVEDAERFASGIEDRLRGARLLGIAPPAGAPIGIEEAIGAARESRQAIAAGALGYAIFIAVAE